MKENIKFSNMFGMRLVFSATNFLYITVDRFIGDHRNSMVIGFTATYAISVYHYHSCEFNKLMESNGSHDHQQVLILIMNYSNITK